MLIPDELMPHGGLVSYRKYLGYGAYGPVYGELVIPERACIQGDVHMVRSQGGDSVVSNATVWLDPEHYLPPNSEVTIWVGKPQERTATVIAVTPWDFDDPLPSYVEAHLT